MLPIALMMKAAIGPWALLVVAFALIPSAWIAWTFRAMPQMGAYHDDAIYLETAQALAETGSYRIESLPERPFQTKYPPLWPWLLSLVWRIDPHFPANLPKILLLCWGTLAFYVMAMFLVLRQWSQSCIVAVALTSFAAVSPHMILAGTMTMSESIFGALLMVSILLLEQGTNQMESSRSRLLLFACAGLAGGLAFLTRTQGIALLISSAGFLLMRKMWREAAAFTAVFGIAVSSWIVWTHSHAYQGSDPTTIYYIDYARFYTNEVYGRDLPVLVQTNIDAFFSAISGVLLGSTGRGLAERMFAWIVAVGTISGVVRLTKETGRYHLVAYGLISSLLLLPCPWPPSERYMVPLIPIVVFGFYRELVHLMAMCRQNLRGTIPQKATAGLLFAGVLGICAACAWGNLHGTFSTLPSIFQDFRDISDSRLDGYKWIRANTSLEANFLSYDDPLLYLYTGRRGYSMPVRHWLSYGGTTRRFDAYFKTAGPFMAEHKLDYAFYTIGDFRRDLATDGQLAFLKELSNPEIFIKEFQTPSTSIYRQKSGSQQHIAEGAWWHSVRDSIPAIE